jgi:pimeloyl-ACP methyl ester carboxylesterase
MFKQMNANILMVEYRGYGDSDSVKPNEKGLKLDAEAALRFISNHPQIDPERIFCFGRSLGGAVAFHLAKYAEQVGLGSGLGSGSGLDGDAAQNMNTNTNTNTNMDCENVQPLAGIMVENTFRSISTMVDQLMPMIAPLKFLVLRMDWSNEKIAPMITTPVLYLAGDRDELVPHDHMHHLYNLSRTASGNASAAASTSGNGNVSKVGVTNNRSTNNKSVLTQMHVIKGGTHNDSWMKGGPQYFEKTRAFMSNIMLNEDGNGNGSTSPNTNTNTRSNSNSFRQSSDQHQHQHQQQPVEVVMGQEDGYGAHNVGELTSRNAIPIMPNNLVGMAKEASKGNENENVSESDKKKNY